MSTTVTHLGDMDIFRELALPDGYFLRRTAIALGIRDQDLSRAVQNRTLIRIRHGAYAPRDEWQSLTAEGQHVTRAHASYALMKGDVALSHVSALGDYGCPLWDVDLDAVHVTRLDDIHTRREGGVIHHRGEIDEDIDVVVRGGRRVTTPARSVVDAMSMMSTESALVAGDWMLRHKLATSEGLWATYCAREKWPNSSALRVRLGLLDGGSGSVGESRSRHLFWMMGVPRPELQYEVRDAFGQLVGVVDFAWPQFKVYGEFDGKIKYGKLLKPGQSASDVVFEEKKREDALRRETGGTMVRFVWSDLHPRSQPAQQLTELLPIRMRSNWPAPLDRRGAA